MPTELRKERDAERRNRTKSKLLDASAVVFMRMGYHRALISQIVSEAGVGQGTFYRNFSSKREIFEALYDRLLGDLLAEVAPMDAQLPTDVGEYRDATVQLFVRFSEVVERNRNIFRLFLREAAAVDREFEEKLHSTFDRLAGLAQFYLDYAIQQGFARPCRSDLVAQSILGMSLRMLDLWLTERVTVASPREMIEELVDFAFQGFGRREEARNGSDPR
jgi:AcrR family transcriptional regulator